MVISKLSDIPIHNILCKEERIKQVGIFENLGFTINQDTRCDTEIKKRIPTEISDFKSKSTL